MKTREQILNERAATGFCCCHTCIERDFEQSYFWFTWLNRHPKKEEPALKPEEIALLEENKRKENKSE